MKLARSTYYYKTKGKKDDSYVLKHIHEASRELNQIGYISMTKILKDRGIKVNKKRIYRIMKENNLLCTKKAPPKPKTTHSQHNFRKFPNLIKTMNPDPFKVIVGDVTYFEINSKDHYLALLMRLLSRRIVGAAISDKNNVQLVRTAFFSAKKEIGDLKDYFHHTDSDVRYCSKEYISLLEQSGMNISMCRGNTYENAHAESLNKTIKYKEINLSEYESFDEAQENIFRFIYLYNTMKPHSALGWMTPQKYEEEYIKKIKKACPVLGG